MSTQLIQQYYSKVEQTIRYGGSRNESSLRKPFQDLLEQYARARNLVLVAEVEMTTKRGTRIRPDGVLKDALRQDWGFWESKDEKDDIEAEIRVKFARGYPDFNILFEDTHVAVLFQGGEEVLRVPFADAAGLDRLLTLWVSYEPREVIEFHKAIELFSAEVGGLAKVLREVISDQLAVNSEFKTALTEFLALCQKSINPKIEMADVREMVIQHVLTEDIFMRVFDEAEFHRENVIAHKLAEVAGTFYHGDTKRNIHARIAPYYETINARASQISDHHEKQKFLKALYESFYKAYNPKAADRLGIVYTPDEIVRFMIESADHLTWQHFGKGLGERGVEILDPATGTGTFITELIEYLPPAQLAAKYEHEIHCNEVSILPYYIANLNIEYTFKQKTGQYKEFENICFVDTLDNMGFEHTGQQLNFFGLTDANAERITRQNSKPIMVVIGNPPYNANQANENDNNKNREYPEIDARIKETYIKHSAAHKTKLYDMYARFLRWASDRLGENGIVAFITNNSFLNARTYDGFRKVVAKEFNHIYILDLGGNVRKNPKLSGTTHNVFGIQAGVAITFFVKEKGGQPCQIYYARRPEEEHATEKLQFLSSTKFKEVPFERIQPSQQNNWLDLSDNDFGELLPLALSGGTKLGKSNRKDKNALFDLFSFGVVTNRDEWVYDFSAVDLEKKVRFLIEEYDSEKKRFLGTEFKDSELSKSIKWTQDLKRFLRNGTQIEFNQRDVRNSMYRPFCKTYLYLNKNLNWSHYQIPGIFPNQDSPNIGICFTGPGSEKPFMSLAVNGIPDLHFAGAAVGTQCLPLYRYPSAPKVTVTSNVTVTSTEHATRLDNITDWALGQFEKRYIGKLGHGKTKSQSTNLPGNQLTKQDIFHYVYAVLHHPAYRAKYEQNLKREFPRIPFYADFWQWAEWGRRLMELHLGYEAVEPFVLERIDATDPLRPSATSPKSDWGTSDLGEAVRESLSPPLNSRSWNLGEAGRGSKPRLIARKETGVIEIDSVTALRGVPPEAWEYRLGTYSALEWVLERYKEKKPKDPTIAEKFNTYRFADYKESVIELLGKVCSVSVETMRIVKEMENLK